MIDKQWTYKGHRCSIEHEYMDDNTKAYHFVTMPGDSEPTFADITPYDSSKLVVERWIDAGYPTRDKAKCGGVGPLYLSDLEALIGD